jgi:hypothetical protein
MGKTQKTWRIRQLRPAPQRGARWPSPLEETPGRLRQSSHGVLIALAAIANGLHLFQLSFVVILLGSLWLGRWGGSHLSNSMDVLRFVVWVSVLSFGPMLARLASRHRPVRWSLDRDSGWGTVTWPGSLLSAPCRFPLGAVRRVVLSARPNRPRRAATVALELVDAHWHRRRVALCYTKRDRAEQIARRVADWLGVELRTASDTPSVIPCTAVPLMGKGGGQVPVPVTHNATALAMLTPGHLVARYKRQILLLAPAAAPTAIWFGIFGILFAVAVRGFTQPGPWGPRRIMMWFALAIFAASPLWFVVHGRGRFDRRRGVLQLWRGLRGWRTLRLERVVAVQSITPRATPANPRCHHEVNLCLRDGTRLTVSSNSTTDKTAAVGRQIAAYLAVPWVDHTEEPACD